MTTVRALTAKVEFVMRKLYSILDNTYADADYDISDGGTILACSASGVDSHRMCRCTVPLSDTISQFETMTWGSGSLTNGSLGAVYVGIANASAPTNKYVGEDANGYGFRFDDGKLYNNGTAVATFTPCALNDLVYFRVNFDNNQILISVIRFNSSTGIVSTIGTYQASTTNTVAWYPAITTAGGTAFSLQTFFNAGQRTFEYATDVSGWWDSAPIPAAVYLATDPYRSLTTDQLANQRFDAVNGALIGDKNMSFPRGVTFWFDKGDSKASAQLSTFLLEDSDGTYDYILDHRNARMGVATVDQTGSYDAAQVEDTVILDRAETHGDQAKTLYMNDPIAEILSKPFNTAYFLPNQDASVVDTPLPVLIGMARNFEPVLEDAANRIYRISDTPIGAIGAVRVQGKLLVFGTDYTLLADGMRIQLTAAPTGKLTVEASGVVQGIPPGPTDLLSGNGNFGAMTTPAAWQANWYTYFNGNDAYTNGDRPCWFDVFAGGHTPGVDDAGGLSGSNGSVLLDFYASTLRPQNYVIGFRTKTNVIQNGKSYACKITFWDAPYVATQQPLDSTTTYPANFFIDGHHDAYQYYPKNNWTGMYYSVFTGSGGKPGSADLARAGGVCSAVFFNTGLNIQPFADICPATITASFTNTTGADLPLCMDFINGNGGSWWIRSIFLYELPDAVDAAPLNGVGLEDYMRAVLLRAGVDETQWDASEARAIDTATGYQIGNWFNNQATTVEQALQPALDTFGAGIYRKRDGRMGVARKIDPDTVADANVSWEIDENDILTEPYVYPDVMRSLTTSSYGRRNISPCSESDFTNMSTTDVSLAERKLLQRKFQFTYTSGVQLSEVYNQAQLTAPHETLLDSKTDMKTETERLAALAIPTRKYYHIDVKTPPGTQYDINQVGKVTYKWNDAKTARRYGLNASKVYVEAVIPNPALQTCTLVCWR